MIADEHEGENSGPDLYQQLGLQKGCAENDIRKAYRKLALRYHPDKNPDNPEAAAKFVEISRAYNVLNDPKKRELYDRYGSFGLYIVEQMGEEAAQAYLRLNSRCCKAFLIISCILTGGCFCCCCCCCFFNFCCGKCRPKTADYNNVPGEADQQDAVDNLQGGAAADRVVIKDTEDSADGDKPIKFQPLSNNDVSSPITTQPRASSNDILDIPLTSETKFVNEI